MLAGPPWRVDGVAKLGTYPYLYTTSYPHYLSPLTLFPTPTPSHHHPTSHW